MQGYIIRRLLLCIPTVLLVTVIVFFLARFIPGSVVDLMVAEMGQEGGTVRADVAAERIRAKLGLDVPVHIQYGRWLGVLPKPDEGFSGFLQGNLGKTLWRDRPISQEIAEKIPVSFELGLLGLIIALLFALPIGIYSAIRQDTVGDYIARTFAILNISLPSFWVATMVIVLPALWWGWTPPMRYIPLVQDPLGNLQQFILPAFIMGMATSGGTMRMMRTMMLEVLRQDYIRTAWSKGLNERTVIVRHALKNALIPIVTIVGARIPMLIAGSVILETIFVLPGVGRLMVLAVQQRDYPVISAINTVIACLIVSMNLVVDISYAWLDPRVQYR